MTDADGYVWKLGHPRKGAIWYPLKPTAKVVHTPGSGIIRRTGESRFVICVGGKIKFHPCPPRVQLVERDEEPDEFPF